MQFSYPITVNVLLKCNILIGNNARKQKLLRYPKSKHKNTFEKYFFMLRFEYFLSRFSVFCIDQNDCGGWRLYELFCSKVSACTIALTN